MTDFRTGRHLPPLPLEEWEPSKKTLHRFLQVIGKIRLALTPSLNHWWHVPLYVQARGLTTGPMPTAHGVAEIRLDLVDHRFEAHLSDGASRAFPLEARPLAELYEEVMGALSELTIDAGIRAVPFDLEPATPFPEDREHASWDRAAITRWWQAILWSHNVFHLFKGRFFGKSTPVHLFWHSFDLAYTRFSGRPTTGRGGAGQVEREAYSHEVTSFGFWAGDDNVREPAYYAYAAPEPEGLRGRPLEPQGASWVEQNGGSLAILPYEAVRTADRPDRALLQFLESAYQAGAGLAGWPVEELARSPHADEPWPD